MKLSKNQWQFAFNALRRASYKWPERNLAYKAARAGYGRYKCARCKEIYRAKEVQMDHILPVKPLNGNRDMNLIVARMYPKQKGWQVLCKGCHSEKSASENKRRKK